jgi:3-oxoacyl-[acyl-carrier protein] reductase
MDPGIRGKRALVRASSKALGLGYAEALAEAGVDLAMNARGAEALEAAAAGVRARHGPGHGERLFEWCRGGFGQGGGGSM